MFNKMVRSLVVIGAVSLVTSLSGCGKSVEEECTEVVTAAWASAGKNVKDNPQIKPVFDSQVAACVVSKK